MKGLECLKIFSFEAEWVGSDFGRRGTGSFASIRLIFDFPFRTTFLSLPFPTFVSHRQERTDKGSWINYRVWAKGSNKGQEKLEVFAQIRGNNEDN